MRWPQDANGWPNADFSRLVLHKPHRWHIQEAGKGETLLLLHGAGGATQSWRGLFPLLAAHYHTVAIDLPGQGFTQLGGRQRCGLDHMAEDILSLQRQEGWKPTAIIAHSAGAAIALRMAEMGAIPRGQIIGINAALGNFKGVAGWLFPMLAKALALNPLTASIFTATASDRTVRNLIKGTGSTLDDAGIALYKRLTSDKGHVDATLLMMAQWRLDGLLERLPKIDRPTTLITGANDQAVPPKTSVGAAGALPNGQHIELPNLGHLAHEEDSHQIAEIIFAILNEKGPPAKAAPIF